MVARANDGEAPVDLERELVERSQRGDRASFNRLVEMHQSGAYALALRMVGDPDVAADVTQEAFLSAFRAIGGFRGASFKPWLLRIVSNACLDHFRAQARRPSTSLEAALDADEDDTRERGPDGRLAAALADTAWDPEALALRAEVVDHIQRALLALQPEQRLALILSDVQGLPYEEIARVMGTSLGTVKSRIARARGYMRDILARRPELFGRAPRPAIGQNRDSEHTGHE
jgi:RNA polymerase sigma-70 factor, ECF subfamily